MRDDENDGIEQTSLDDSDCVMYIRADLLKDGIDGAIQTLRMVNAERVLHYGFAGSSDLIKDTIASLKLLLVVKDDHETERNTLIEMLRDCTYHQQTTFRLMYGRGTPIGGMRSPEDALEMSITDVVAEIAPDKLAWALKQVTNTNTKKP